MNLPFADENLEREGYSDKCDELSQIEAQNHHSSWGRWYMDDGNLCTWVCIPENEKHPVGKVYEYSFEVRGVTFQAWRDRWIQQMTEKKWMGKKGIHDLKKAFNYLTKKFKSAKIDIGNED